MITLFQGPPAFGLPNFSPFCIKVELYLKMTGLSYQTAAGLPRSAPKGKIPWIDDDGQRVADSGFILEHLRAKYGHDLDARLSPAQRAVALAARRMLEEHLYFVMLQMRWLEDESFAASRKVFAPFIPAPLRGLIMSRIRKGTRARLHGQGLGRHARAEVYQLGKQDLDALAALLGSNPYFFGSEPTSFDCTAWAFLASIDASPGTTPLHEQLRAHRNLMDYIDRVRKRYFT